MSFSVTEYLSYKRLGDQGRIPYLRITKFGHNAAVGTSFVPITSNAIYRTPQVSGATTLRIKAGGNANDTAAGSGARQITVQGLSATGAEVTESIATNGASASTSTINSFIRLYRAWVSASGTYATQSAGSAAASITIENTAGTEDWATIEVNGFPESQTNIACYSVPLGWACYLTSIYVNVDANKRATALGFQRANILETAAPYTAMRMFIELGGITGESFINPDLPIEKYNELTDIGFMGAVTSGTAEVDINFELELFKVS